MRVDFIKVLNSSSWQGDESSARVVIRGLEVGIEVTDYSFGELYFGNDGYEKSMHR